MLLASWVYCTVATFDCCTRTVHVVLFPRHTSPAATTNSINMLHTFRDYLHYHIKCSKAYMHLRMSNKSADFLKVLERAKPTSTKPIEKKTFSYATYPYPYSYSCSFFQ